jgi:methylated-DNA-[protein]-cysteine S-methyltransferase
MPQTYYQTPVGVARITETDGFISGINILDAVPEMEQQTSPVLEQTIQQMDEYFAGERRVFDFPMKQSGTDFQQLVCNPTE